MELLINGDIYIKVEPDIIKPDEKQIEKKENELYNLTFEEAQNGITSKTEKKENI